MRISLYGNLRNLLIEGILKEYVTNDIISLRNYLNMSEGDKKRDLPHEYYWLFDDFLIAKYIDYEKPDDYEDYEFMEWLEENDKDMYDRFADYLYKNVTHFNLPIHDSEYPAWAFLVDAKIVKNQWLIHFTNDAEGIAKDGFTKGVDEISKLGLTRFLSDFDKKYGGYNFGYALGDYLRYGRSVYGNYGFNYGDEAVIFRASGIKSFHRGDREQQVIFYGNTAKNIIPIKKTNKGEYGEYGIYDMRDGKLLYENNNLSKVVNWVVKNYDQYRSRLYII
jgi:hypothetical protein